MGDTLFAGAGTGAPHRLTARRAVTAVLTAAACLVTAAPAAVASPAGSVPPASSTALPMTFTDPVDQANPGLDLVSGSVSQDTMVGGLSAHVDFAGALTTLTGTAELRIIAGNIAPDGSCVAMTGREFITVVDLDPADPAAAWKVGTASKLWYPATAAWSGTGIDIAVKGDAMNYGITATCALVSTGSVLYAPSSDFTGVDEVLAKAELPPTKVGNQTAGSTVSDRDNDGVGDIVDRCPNDPGNSLDGCPRTQGAASLRLGARRLVVDRTLTFTPGTTTCPAKVKVIVKQGSHRLGAAKLAVAPATTSGSAPAGCQVKGVVPLKRHKRRSVVRVAITGAGVAPVSQQLVT